MVEFSRRFYQTPEMERRSWLVLFALCLAIASISFELGRWSASLFQDSNPSQANVPTPSEIGEPGLSVSQRSGAASTDSGKTELGSEAADYAKVRIENLGEISFDDALDMLRSAPKEALIAWTKRLEDLPVTPRKTAAINVFFKTLAQIDTTAAVDLALTIDRVDPRWTAIWAVSVATPPANLSEVARMFTTVNEQKISIVSDLISRWSETDPEATARFISTYSGKVDNEGIASFLGNWAALDPASAIEWLAKTDASRRDSRVYANLYAGWILRDRANALRDLAAHATDKTFEKAVKVVSENLFTDSTDMARAFILTLPDTASQEAAVSQITGHITGIYFGGDYLHLDPEEVAKWVLTLPDNLWRDEVGWLIERWAESDQPAVDAWMNQMPPEARDHLLAKQCLALNWNIPTSSFQAGLRVRDPQLRENTFRQVFEKMNAESRQELVEKAELSADEARELQRILKSL